MNRRGVSVDRAYTRAKPLTLQYLIRDSDSSESSDQHDDDEIGNNNNGHNGYNSLNDNLLNGADDEDENDKSDHFNGVSDYNSGLIDANGHHNSGQYRYRQRRPQSMGPSVNRMQLDDPPNDGDTFTTTSGDHQQVKVSSRVRGRSRSKSSERRRRYSQLRRDFGSASNVLSKCNVARKVNDYDSDDEDNNQGENNYRHLTSANCQHTQSTKSITAWNQGSNGKLNQIKPDFWPRISNSNQCSRCNIDSANYHPHHHHNHPVRPSTLFLIPTPPSSSSSPSTTIPINHQQQSACDVHITTTFYPTSIDQKQQQQSTNQPQIALINPRKESIDSSTDKGLLEDVLKTLNIEKETLVYQVNMMNDQIESQNERIKELECSLNNLNSRLTPTSNGNESISTTGSDHERNLCAKVILEETRRSLINEIARLKRESLLSTTTASKMSSSSSTKSMQFNNHQEKTSRLSSLENECASLKATLLEREAETGLLRLALAKIAKNTGYTLSDSELQLIRGSISAQLLLKVGHDLVSPLQNGDDETRCANKPPLVPRSGTINDDGQSTTGRLVNNHMEEVTSSSSSSSSNGYQANGLHNGHRGRSASPHCLIRKSSTSNSPTNTLVEQQSNQINQQTPYSPQRSCNLYGTMPRSYGSQIYQRLQQQQLTSCEDYTSETNRPRPLSSYLSSSSSNNQHNYHQSSGSGFGTKFNIVTFAQDDQTTRRSQSSNPDIYQSTGPNTNGNKDNKAKGIKKFFSIIKRSDSNFNDNGFNRGGIRATTGPRLVAGERRRIEVNLPFSRLDNILLAQWLSMIGLGMYSDSCRRSIKSGDHLLSLSDSELEKDLGIKNKLHRKKLRLALTFVNNDVDPLTRQAHQLDYLWVARWLDDIGLPQYKENFINGRIDGAVLHRLTVQDLVHLNINSKVHYYSIRRGIQLLRSTHFNTDTLKRRAPSSEIKSNDWKPEEIAQWTSHRVMEWLRSIELSEYTPNLRGSGIHGALIIYEPAFDCDLLASLLSIPSSRTLLRRHIATHFNQLIGFDLVQMKREYRSNNPILTPSSKISVKNVKFSIIKRRLKTDLHLDDLVCPMDDNEIKQSSDDNDDNINATTIDNKMFLQSESQV
ncbi:liprin-beta-2-like isoform X2 [Panonychus citri]|uniref:liprin-beta-2-like isoform X2 n=1 Tax=Panonychus citri TaxID=50023 RepID=UPI002306EB16|nr:liprin-beta-2-like isoform X2 [Panonychus citri]